MGRLIFNFKLQQTPYVQPNKRRYWTQAEDDLLRELCSNASMPYRDIAAKVGRSRNAVAGRAFLLGLSNDYNPRKYTKDDQFFQTPNPVNSYYAGLLAADGCVNWEEHCVRWSLEMGDVEALRTFQKLTRYTGQIGYREKRGLGVELSKQNYLDVYGAQQWCDDLHRNFGIVPAKTHRVAPPNTTNDLLNACFIVGYIDGDGSLSFTDGGGKAISITSCSQRILEFIKAFLDRHFHPEHGSRYSNVLSYDNHHTFAVSGNKAIHLFDFLRALPVPKFDRKWENPEILRVINERKARRPDLFKPGHVALSFDETGMIRRHDLIESFELRDTEDSQPLAA